MAQALLALGVSAGTVATISTIATVATPVIATMGAIANYQAGKAQQAEFNRQAKEERVTSSIQAARTRRDARLKQSMERTAMAESGALSGTSFGVLEQNAVARELDALTVEYQGEQRAVSAEARAEAARPSPLSIFSAALGSTSNVDPMNIGGRV